MTRILILTVALAYLLSPLANSGERQVTPRFATELPDFTIARQYSKYRQRYPFITPIEVSESGDFIAYNGLTYHRIGERQLQLDLFQPKGAEEARPAVILVHGGGWRTGDRSHQIPMAQALAEAGFVGVTVEHRLSREALYPAAVIDLQAAVRWIKLHGAEYGVDVSRIVLLGASSGAHLATLAGSVGHMSEFAGQPSRSDGVGSAVQAIINLDGVVDLMSPRARENEDKPGKVSYAGLWLGGRYRELPTLWQQASPLRYAGADTPPTLFINSAKPRFHVGRDEFVATLDRHGIHSEVHTLENTPHAFWLFHPWFDRTRDLIITFLNRTFPRRDSAPQPPQVTAGAK